MIAFPPCTYLSYAGMANWYDNGRALKRIEAAKFFMQLYESPINHICIENPRGIMTKIFKNCSQEIHPYFFGDCEMKRTQLWLKNLPLLQYSLQNTLFEKKTSSDIPKPNFSSINKKTGKLKNRYFTDSLVANRFKTGLQKSKTFEGIANAMAIQFTDFIEKSNQRQMRNRIKIKSERVFSCVAGSTQRTNTSLSVSIGATGFARAQPPNHKQTQQHA